VHQVLCDGGLANRLNALLVALTMKQHTQSAWGIAWPVNNWCGAPFEDLFESTLPVTRNGLSNFKAQQDRYWQVFHENQIEFDESRITYNKKLTNFESLIGQIGLHPRIVYFHHLIPDYVTDGMLFDALAVLKPKSTVVEAVKKVLGDHGVDAKTYGVHIRKTDFGDSVDELSLYEKISKSNGRFFICSDSNEVLVRFAQLENCVALPKPSMPRKLREDGGWNAPIQDADGRIYPFNVDRDRASVFWGLVDLLILSKTEMLVTSGSSFLGLAQRLKRVGWDY
jgi:hypothetical protein